MNLDNLLSSMNPFNFYITKEIMDIKLGRIKRPGLQMEYHEDSFYSYRFGNKQFTWKFGEDRRFYFLKEGKIRNSISY